MSEPSERDQEIATSIVQALLLDDDPTAGVDGVTRIVAALAIAREEGRRAEQERCAAIADESARLGDEDGAPDVVASARIIARKIRLGRSQWRPIETAPKAYLRMVLVWWEFWKPVPFCGWWSSLDNQWEGDYAISAMTDGDPGPTHWMPLPEPPK